MKSSRTAFCGGSKVQDRGARCSYRTHVCGELPIHAEHQRVGRGGRGDGRVYRIAYTVSDGTLSCSGVTTVGVPRRNGETPVDSRGSFNSFETRRGTRKGDRFVVRSVKIYSGRKVIARGLSLIDQRRPKKLRISSKRTPTSTVRISNLAPGMLKFNVTADKLRTTGRTTVTTQIRRTPK